MLITKLALLLQPAAAADYAVPAAHASIQAAVDAALSDADPAPVILIASDYNPDEDNDAIDLTGFAGTLRGVDVDAWPMVPAMHGVDTDVTLEHLIITPAMRFDVPLRGLYTQFGVHGVGGRLVARNVEIPGGYNQERSTTGVFLEESPSILLEGVNLFEHSHGAAILGALDITVRDSWFESNRNSDDDFYARAAALHVLDDSVATVANCIFFANERPRWVDGGAEGGIVLAGRGTELTLTGGEFEANAGTPIHSFAGALLDVSDTTVTGTTDAISGAVFVQDTEAVHVARLAVTESSGEATGAIVIVALGQSTPQRSHHLTDYTIADITVTASSSDDAGAIAIAGAAEGTITNVSVDGYSAGFMGIGVSLVQDARGHLERIAVSNSDSYYGGAIFIDGEYLVDDRGRAAACEDPDVTIVGVEVSDIDVPEGGALLAYGGCITITDVMVIDSYIWNNGGILHASDGAKVTASDISGANVYADSNGGAFFASENAQMFIEDVELADVTAWNGGVAAASYGGSIEIERADITGSASESYGGLFYADGGGSITGRCISACGAYNQDGDGHIAHVGWESELVLRSSVFLNSAVGYDYGAAVQAAYGGHIELDGNSFLGLAGGEVFNGVVMSAEITNNVFALDADVHAGSFGQGGENSPIFAYNAWVNAANIDDIDNVFNDTSDIEPTSSGFDGYDAETCAFDDLEVAPGAAIVDAGRPGVADYDLDGSRRDIGHLGGPLACPSYVDEDGDGFLNNVDCDDTNADINPDAEEIPYNGVDEDCSGADLCDVDEDGFLAPDGTCGGDDCDDTAAGIHPDAEEIPYNGVDEDCSGADLCDVDGDGVLAPDGACGGADCDDDDDTIYPGATEVPDDGIDQDCSGADTCTTDADNDGHIALSCGGDDCDDTAAGVNPTATEIPYNGIDEDCSGADLCDVDGDGYLATGGTCAGDDCDDNAAGVNPGATEIPNNGIDEDCSGADLACDADGDGYDAASCGGDDCNDADAAINPGATEVWYNGVDEDCDGNDDDQDEDSFPLAADCDDEDAAINPDAEEIPNNEVDEDCDTYDAVRWLQGGCSTVRAPLGAPMGGWLALGLVMLGLRRREVSL